MTKKYNGATMGLTGAEFEVFAIIADRTNKGQTTNSGKLVEAWGNKNRSYAYRVVMRLVLKGFVEVYDTNFYRITDEARKHVVKNI